MDSAGTLRKYQVVNLISASLGLQKLLEISTPTTGQTFAEALESGNYVRADRLVYRCPPDHSDGLPIAFRTESLCSSALLRSLLMAEAKASPYDVIFVDPYHTWWCSMTDLVGAWTLLRPGGVMVVHDCNPPTAHVASPTFVTGSWCGVTYQAFVELMLGGIAADHFTVDADFGVGVVFKGEAPEPSPDREPIPRDLLAGWGRVRDSDEERYAFFDQHRKELLRLVSEDWLVDRYAGGLLAIGAE